MPIRLRALASVALALAGCDVASGPDGPEARGGLMDLSRWDFETQGPVALRGEWVFRWGELPGPTAFPKSETPAPPMIVVPRPWNGVVVEGAPLGGEGFATQALRLSLPPNNHDLGLAFGEAYSAERLWMNGRLIVERGRIGRTRATEVAGVRGSGSTTSTGTKRAIRSCATWASAFRPSCGATTSSAAGEARNS